VQPVDRVDRAYELTLPLVVGPRFDALGEAWNPPGERVADVVDPALVVSAEVNVAAGFPLRDVEMPGYPDAAIVEDGGRIATWVSGKGLHRDVVLRWRAEVETPQAAFLVQDDHGLVVFEAPADPPREAQLPREVIWVIDKSGSMAGEPLDLVKAAVRDGIRGMDERDSFAVLAFDGGVRGMSRHPVPATPYNRAAGMQFVSSLAARGGTYLVDGVVKGLEMPRDDRRERFVVFLTDGYVTVEQETLAAIADLSGGAHVFAFGVGDAPNRFLLDEMARVGGGTVTWMRSDDASPEALVRRFLDTIERPVLSDIEIVWGAWEAEHLQPATLPTLFADQPLMVTARFSRGGGPIVVRGRLGDEPYMEVLEPIVAGRQDARSIPVTWARQRIAELERQLFWGQQPEVEAEIVEVSLAYRVLSRFTAFIAVDPELPPPDVEDDWYPEDDAFFDAEVLVVNAHGSVDTMCTSVGRVLGKQFLQRIPSGRSYQSALYAVMAVHTDRAANGLSAANAFLLDGTTLEDRVSGTFLDRFNATSIRLYSDDVAPESPHTLPIDPTLGQPVPRRPGIPVGR
jgi:Ca-activated chloride channel family protein